MDCDIRRLAAGDLGNLVAEHYRQRGDVVEFLPDPAAGTVELMVLVKGRRRVVLCVAGGREVTPPVVRELVGTQRIEHADDATLVSTGIGTESALNLATEQAVQWVGPDELESWMKLRNAPQLVECLLEVTLAQLTLDFYHDHFVMSAIGHPEHVVFLVLSIGSFDLDLVQGLLYPRHPGAGPTYLNSCWDPAGGETGSASVDAAAGSESNSGVEPWAGRLGLACGSPSTETMMGRTT